MKINSFYILVLVLVVSLFFITKKLYNGSGKTWVGVAEAKDYTITSEKQATVKSIHVVQGQAISKGDTLIILFSNNLMQDMDKLTNRISVLQSERSEKQNLVNSEIELLKSNHSVDVVQLEKEISQAESELKLNKSIATDLKISPGQQISPLEEKVKALKSEIELRNQSLQIKIKDLQIKNTNNQTVLQNQVDLLKHEFSILQSEVKSLTKISQSDGVIEAIPVKQGEEVDAYTNLLSILPKSPTAAIGYLASEKEAPAIGTKVLLTGYDARWKSVEGKVIGYGAIASLPEILQKSTAVKAFGKEIFIEMPAANNFSTGEKLLIRL